MFKRLNDEINGFNSLEKKWSNLFRPKEPFVEESTISSRFVQLFEEHDIHRNQIPRFFGNGLTLSDIETNTTLLPKLTPCNYYKLPQIYLLYVLSGQKV